MEEEKKSASAVEKEGEKVTGGADAKDKEANKATPENGGEEYVPDNKATKKEEATGYNELPEQSKVGGG